MGSDDNNSNNIVGSRMWEWQEEDFSLQRDPEIDMQLWDDMINQSDNNLLYMLGEHTPSKDCADFGYGVFDVGDKTNKELEECRDSSQTKRRRMLQFTSDADDNGRISSASESSKTMEKSFFGDELLKCLEWDPEWSSSFSDDRGEPDRRELGQSSEGLLANCFTERTGEMSSSVNDSVASDDLVEAVELHKVLLPEMENAVVQKNNPAFCRVFRGKKSYMKTPTKLTTSVAYPFALVKPCGIQGDVTLKDINQRIHTPPPEKSNKKGEYPFHCYPASAITGKPVVVKTKIRTEGGKGSITIMRTKG